MRTPVAYVTNLRLKFPGAADLQFKDFSLSVAKGEKVLLARSKRLRQIDPAASSHRHHSALGGSADEDRGSFSFLMSGATCSRIRTVNFACLM